MSILSDVTGSVTGAGDAVQDLFEAVGDEAQWTANVVFDIHQTLANKLIDEAQGAVQTTARASDKLFKTDRCSRAAAAFNKSVDDGQVIANLAIDMSQRFADRLFDGGQFLIRDVVDLAQWHDSLSPGVLDYMFLSNQELVMAPLPVMLWLVGNSRNLKKENQ